MQLSKKIKPEFAHLFELPERVLQFGTGVFIRGLIDYFIDKANKEGNFNGRVVMVKSTDAGDINDFRDQDCLYTLLMKDTGIEERVLCAGVSRVLDARDEWDSVLACAVDPGIRLIVSNTTEAGIVLVKTDLIGGDGVAVAEASSPVSFPGKLLAVLWARWKALGGSADSGLVIVPTELIPDNATLLKGILNELARINGLDHSFIRWMNEQNDFCNSLVDRIVPGRLPAAQQRAVEAELGYEDRGMIMAEPFGLWAIETNRPRTRAVLSFSRSHGGIRIVENIEKYRELKLRLLNASHNLSCALGYLAGFKTVREAMADAAFDEWMRGLILGEIAAAIVSDDELDEGRGGPGNEGRRGLVDEARRITAEDAREFGSLVLERYRNPYIAFDWLSICVQDTSKLRIRAVPVILQYYNRFGFVGEHMSMGMAAYILFMRGGKGYVVEDEYAENLREKWQRYSGLELVKRVLGDESLWGVDLALLNGFAENVAFAMEGLEEKGVGIFKKQII
jgi:tagaturonate reductase